MADRKDNDHFKYVNQNPFGLNTGDCVFRSLSLFFGRGWRETAEDLNKFTLDHGLVANWLSGYSGYLRVMGFKRKDAPKHPNGRKYTIGEFAAECDKKKYYLCVSYGHMTFIRDGIINDTWDCSKRKVQYWWERDPETGDIELLQEKFTTLTDAATAGREARPDNKDCK